MLGGALLGTRIGAAAQVSYLALGAVGLPAFAGGAGLAYLFGPTGGYLFGFVMGAIAVGRLIQAGAGRTFGGTFIAMLIGTMVIVGMGSLYLSLFYGGDFLGGLVQGAVPFFGGAVVKSAAAAAIYQRVARRTQS